ncbi:MAG: hypothetical protein ACRDS9_15320, partial [Pseudonocardiaceae bacterium]
SLILLIVVVVLKLSGRLQWAGLIASLLLGASLATLLMPALEALATGLQAGSAFFSDATN